MEQSYLSASWYRVAKLKLKLRSHSRIHRNTYRGQVWYVLQDRTSGRFHRFTQETYLVISLMTGERTMEEVWEVACSLLDDKTLTQDEVIALLGQLHSADVLYGDVPPDIVELADRSRRTRRRKFVMNFMNPLAVRFGLVDPDDFLAALLPIVRPLFSVFGLIVFIGLVGYAATLVATHWGELTRNVTDRALSAGNIIVLLIAFPLIKALHELGHAFAVKRWGGDVHEIGIMMLVFMPVPYVDASDSLSFQDKWQRVVVGAAGILVEMVLASIAMIVWVNAEEGLVRAFAFNIMLIGGVSTLLFNGNPLLKFDGYYVFSDIIEIPNLAQRANQYLAYLIQRYAFDIRSAVNPVTAPGEAKWFVFYAIAAFLYRLFIMFAIVTLVATHFFIVGTIIAIWALILMVGLPLGKQLRFFLTSPLLRRNRARAFGVVGGVLAAVAIAGLFVPLPNATTVQGVVWLPGNGIVHAGADGVVAEVLARPEGAVVPGDIIVRLDDPLLRSRADLLEVRVAELDLRLAKLDLADLANAQIVREELRHAQADLELARRNMDALAIRAPTAGTLILPNATDLVGRFIKRGETVGYVAEFAHPVIRVIVPEDDADIVRNQTTDVAVRFVADPSRAYAAEVAREVPAMTDTLPSSALSTAGGGQIALDPRDPGQRKVLANLLQLDVRLRDGRDLRTLGGRVYVRFSHRVEPIAGRLYRMVQQVFLKTFQI